MASLLALLSSALWGSADFFAGRMSKKHHPFAVLGFSQVIGLFVGILILVISGNWQGKVFGFEHGVGAARSRNLLCERCHETGEIT